MLNIETQFETAKAWYYIFFFFDESMVLHFDWVCDVFFWLAWTTHTAQHNTAQESCFVKLNYKTSIPREIPDTPIYFKPKIKNKKISSSSTLRSHRIGKNTHTPRTHSYSLSSIRIGEHQKEMAPPEAEGQVQQRRQPQQQGGFSSMITGVIRMAVFWYFASKFFSPKRPSGSEPSQLISNLFHKSEPLVLSL